MKNKALLVIFTLAILFLSSFKQDSHKLSIHMESQRLVNGKVIKIIADLYFKYSEGVLTIHYTHPNDYVLSTNSKGEVKVYYPKKNEVIIQQNSMFSSENDILYMFLANKQNDMGLTEAGFKLVNSVLKDKMQITTWSPPVHKTAELSKIELVHENYLPIYAAYYNAKSILFKKIYYSDYYTGFLSPIPLKIVDIDYTPKGDSIISRKLYTDFKTGSSANNPYFNFTIPANAKISIQK